jgi:hypothetical protein
VLELVCVAEASLLMPLLVPTWLLMPLELAAVV